MKKILICLLLFGFLFSASGCDFTEQLSGHPENLRTVEEGDKAASNARQEGIYALQALWEEKHAENTLYTMYDDVLFQYAEMIGRYDWQCFDRETKAVALWDIYGDDAPELIFAAAPETEVSEGLKMSELHIFTVLNGEAKEIFKDYWDSNAGGGFLYALFTEKDEKALYGYIETGDESWIRLYVKFTEKEDGMLEQTVLYSEAYEIVYDEAFNPTGAVNYYEDEEVISESDYQMKSAELLNGIETIMMASGSVPSPEMQTIIDGKGTAAMSVYEARELCREVAVDGCQTPLCDALAGLSFGYINPEPDLNGSDEKEIYVKIGDDGAYKGVSFTEGYFVEPTEYDDGLLMKFTKETRARIKVIEALGPHIYQIRLSDIANDIDVDFEGSGVDGNFRIDGDSDLGKSLTETAVSDCFIVLPGAAVSELPEERRFLFKTNGEIPGDFGADYSLYLNSKRLTVLKENETIPYDFTERN